jgi:hypothetical protein
MGKQRKLYVTLLAGMLFVTLIGCEKKQQAGPAPHVPLPIETTQPPIDEKIEPADKTEPGDVSTNSIESAKQSDESEQPKQVGQTDQPKANKPSPTPKPAIQPEDTYEVSKPTLMGLQLNTSKSTVITKFGEPQNQHKLEDDGGVINVMNYDDFSVGLNTDNQVEYIEVQTDEIDPGLGGIKVGSTSSDVIDKLGKPSSNSSYVMSYNSPGAVLKLDVDIDLDQIISIKLFPEKT